MFILSYKKNKQTNNRDIYLTAFKFITPFTVHFLMNDTIDFSVTCHGKTNVLYKKSLFPSVAI